MKNLYVLLILIVSSASAALANDTRVYGTGGTIKRMGGEDANIRMEAEWVNVDVYDKTYEVSATFNFINDSDEEQTVQMGFPESGGGGDVDINRVGFTSFSSKVDDIPLEVKRIKPRAENTDDTMYQAYWVKEVTFLPRQTRLVQVNYTSPTCDVSSPPYHFVQYNFTGGNWKGKVASSEILFTFHGAGTWQFSSDTAFSQNENELYYQWKNWEAEMTCEIYFSHTLPGILMRGYGTSDKHTYHVTIPGESTPNEIEGEPYAFFRGDIIYGSLDSIDINTQDWDAEPGAIIARIGRATLTFKPGSEVMKTFLPVNVDGKVTLKEGTVKLPGKPVLIKKEESDEQLLYVPIEPVLKALNGTYKLDRELCTISYSFTKEGLADFVTETVATAPLAVAPAAVPVNPEAKAPAASTKANALPMNWLAGLGALLVVLLAGYMLKRRKTVV